jgi:hypothetical protein
MPLEDFLLYWALGFCWNWLVIDRLTSGKLTWRGIVALFLTWPVVTVASCAYLLLFTYVLLRRR